MTTYEEFLRSKALSAPTSGFEPAALNASLFPFQADVTRWAIRRGRAAVFLDCGLGKSLVQLAWARAVATHTGGRVLVLAPLAVAAQTVREATKFGIDGVKVSRVADADIVVSNYEKLHLFDPKGFVGVVLDESSILKSLDGQTRTRIIETFDRTPYKLACTATPAPNDHMELGNHAEFLGVMTRSEMLSMFFVHDGGETQKWRLKKHAEASFWEWVASWAVMLRKPSDLGYSDEGFDLPELRIHEHIVASKMRDGLFAAEAKSLIDQRAAKRDSLGDRVALAANLVNGSRETWLCWVELNDEGDALERATTSVQIAGADDNDIKASRMMDFVDGRTRVLISKPKIAGFGMNLQCCANVVFVGVTHSYEQFYQAVRRCWRFGQSRPVNVHVIASESEVAVLASLRRKERDAETMVARMVEAMSATQRKNVLGVEATRDDYSAPLAMRLPDWVRSES
jgi:superfamily II DNA or RNA helicase